MQKLSSVGSLLKRIYRIYSSQVLVELQNSGFSDLRPSFLEILMYLVDHNAPSIKEVGEACGLKKQTMTSHLNELESRGYIVRKTSPRDRREQLIHLTEYGEKFKFALQNAVAKKESEYLEKIGEVEMDRMIQILESFHSKIDESKPVDTQQILI